MRFRDDILLYALVPLTVLLIGASSIRFFIAHDYMVSYKDACDPAVHSCFIDCKDDGCTEKDYYAKIQKYAADLYKQCGENITNCEAAGVCLQQNDRGCSITYCDPKIDGKACEPQGGSLSISSNDQMQPTGDVLQQGTSSNSSL